MGAAPTHLSLARLPAQAPLWLLLAGCSLAASVVVASPVQAQGRKARAKKTKVHYPLSTEARALLRTADRARASKDWDTACVLYRQVLDQDVNSVAAHPDAEPGEPLRLIGVKEWAIRGLRALPPEGVSVWREKFDYRAESAFKKARLGPRSYFDLSAVYDLYPISGCAKEILSLLADRSLQRGELGRARKNLRALLRHHSAELVDQDPVRRKLLLCAIGLGDPVSADAESRALLHGQETKVLLGRSLFTPAELVAQALQREAERTGRYRGAAATGLHPRGDLANRACYDGEPVFGPVMTPRFQFGDDMPGWRGNNPRGRYRPSMPGAALPRSLAVVYDGQVFVPSADQLHSIDLETGRPRRRIRRLQGRPIYPDDDNDKVQFGACIGQATLVAPLVEQVQRDQSFRGIPIKVKIPRRKLCAFDLEKWSWEWDHAKLLKGTPYESWSFPATPTAHEGRVYATGWSIEGYVNANVACFDLATGEPLWGALIASGQVEQTMFGEQASEPLCTPLALVDGVLYVVSQIGCVAALDADTGRLLWITEYDTIQVRAAKGYFPDHRDIRWENNAPLVESDVVIAAPLDSWAFFGFDRHTGKRLWRASQRLGGRGTESDMRYLVGADQGRVVLAGGGDVRCVDVQTGLLKWRSAVGTRQVAGRGCLIGGRACVPLDDGSVTLFDLQRGRQVGQTRLSVSGNLLPCGRALVVVGSGSVAVHRLGSQSQGAPRRPGGAPPGGDPPGKDFK